MPADRSPNVDPYRILGLEPGASMVEVKRAYRLLAKAFHPDSAGEATLPRFLAIHEAYEQLRTGRVPPVRTSRSAAGPAPAEPWRADPARAQAARERARARARQGRAGAAGSPGARSASGSAAGAGPQGRPTSTSSGASGAGTGRAGRRQTRKATMGSTSYDEARDHNDPTWSGASWYGPSSGEYWIVNPREYADPRKHGPDYQQRGRRPIDDPSLDEAPIDEIPIDESPNDPVAARASAATGSASAGRASTASGAGWASPAGDRARRPEPRPRRPPDRPPERRPDPASRRPGEYVPDGERLAAIEAASRAWLGGPADDPIRRLGLALVAWPPIGLGAAAAIGDVTGCSSYAASCGGSDPLLPWLAQAVLLGLLLLLPPITRVLAGGAVAVLLALVPITLFLVAVGGTGATQAGAVLAILLGAAWIVGVAWAARASVRRADAARAGP